MSKASKYLPYIQSKLDERELLEALAEEAVELSQAALKLIRANGSSKNVTPVAAVTAADNVVEEIGDVISCAMALGMDVDCMARAIKRNKKWKRWKQRLAAEEN